MTDNLNCFYGGEVKEEVTKTYSNKINLFLSEI